MIQKQALELEADSSKELCTSDSNNSDSECNNISETFNSLSNISINTITAQESLLLDLIDNITDKEQKRQIIEQVISLSKGENKLKPKMQAIVHPSYKISKIYNRMKKEKPITINDLKQEINSLKTEVQQLRK